MGAVKRVVYNNALMDVADYTNTKCLKMLLSNFDGLEQLFLKGDTVAGAILIDLKTKLGFYDIRECVLTDLQRESIILNLIYGLPQNDVAKVLNVQQRMISYYVNQGLAILSDSLEGKL